MMEEPRAARGRDARGGDPRGGPGRARARRPPSEAAPEPGEEAPRDAEAEELPPRKLPADPESPRSRGRAPGGGPARRPSRPRRLRLRTRRAPSAPRRRREARGAREGGEKDEDVIPGAAPRAGPGARGAARRRASSASTTSTPTPTTADEDGEAGEDGGRARAVAHTPLELAADARYHATGKRKSAIARVILKPGEGTYTINGRHLDEYFPRVRLQRMARQPLEAAGYDTRMDVVARIHGGGVSAQANALRHGIARALVEADPQLRARAQAPRLPDSRPAREGAQEGRPQEGPQAAAVLEALEAPWRAVRDRRGPRRRGRVPDRGAGAGLGRAAALTSPAEHPQVLIVRDTRESGEMLEAALAAGHRRRRRARPARRRAAHPGAALLVRRYGFDMAAVVSASHNPYQGQRHQVLRPRGHEALGRARGRDRAAARQRAERRASGAVRELHGAGSDYLRELELRFAELDLSGRACCSTAPTARPTAWRPRSSAAWAPT